MGDKLRIVFTGDIAFSKHMADAWQGDGCFSDDIRQYLQAADFVVGNIEGPVTDAEENSGTFLHKTSGAAGKYLADQNIRIWSLANNHSMDFGEKGLADTARHAEELSCRCVGAGKDLRDALTPVVVGEEVKAGILSVTQPLRASMMAGPEKPGAAGWDRTDELRGKIEELRGTVDWIVLVVHGGEEFCDLPMPYIREQYLAMLDLGADVIVAHHPHVVQPYEFVNGKIIFYSLGNFVFDTEFQRSFSHASSGVLAGLDLGKDSFAFDHLAFQIQPQSHKIAACPAPPVFRELRANEYEQIWPFAARCFQEKLLRKKAVLGRWWTRSKVLTFFHELYSCRKPRERKVITGKWRSYFRRWNQPEYKDLFEYMKE